ncbi:MAG: sulfur carrier protein ThiS [Gammaproteobacteria bacterium]|nr:sulfur carrier protein ThiS [Gammaproteobacteria bacterium]
MEIRVNGETRNVASIYTVADLIQDMDLGRRRFAVEVNRKIIPRGQHEKYLLQSQDQIEIVHAIGGG